MLKWLIVELEKQVGGRKRNYKLVNERSLVAGVGTVELHTGKVVSLRHGYKAQKAHIVMVSEDRRFLEEQIKILEQQQSNGKQHQSNGRALSNETTANVKHSSSTSSNGSRNQEVVAAATSAVRESAARILEQSGARGLEHSAAKSEDGSPDGTGDYSNSGTDWDPDTQSSSDSELDNKRKCLREIKREHVRKRASKARGPSLRAELPAMRNTPAMRSYSRISMDNQRIPTDNQRISMDNQRIPIENQRIPIENQRIPMDNQRMSMDNQRIPMDNHRISMENQRIPVDNQRISIDKQRIPMDNQRMSTDNQRMSMDQQRISMDNQRTTMDNQWMPRLSKDNQIQFMYNYSADVVIPQQLYENVPNGKMVMTFDQQSQTDIKIEDTHGLTGTISMLQGEVQRLTQMLTEMQDNMECMKNALGLQFDPFDSTYSVREEVVVSEPDPRSNPVLINNSTNQTIKQRNNVLLEMNRIENHEKNKRRSRPRRLPSRVERNLSNSYDSDGDPSQPDMVPIGSGKTLIPKHIYTQIDWNSHTIATRKLLMAVFPRRTLATHSLTGKASPAFMSKPAKLRLDMKKVTDIVMTVVENCGVRESLVRSCITTKCADENKMYRMRLQKKANKSKKNVEEPILINQENTPPGRTVDVEPIQAQYSATPGTSQYQ